MSKILILSIVALCFATGFTCSKNAPQQAAVTEVSAPSPQTEMVAPVSADASASASADVAPVAPTETK